MTSSEHVVILGSGQAGLRAAARLRSCSYGGQVTLAGDEPTLPYYRPPLSKDYLKHGNDNKLWLRKKEFFKKQNINLKLGCRAISIDRKVRRTCFDDGQHLDYDHLILALGARNRILPVPGIDLDGVISLRTLEDAREIRARMTHAKRLVVVGGGFIGLEFAASAHKQGVEVTVIESQSRLMSRVVCPAVSDYFLDAYQSVGVDVQFARRVDEIVDDGRGNVAGVGLAGADAIRADLVLIAIGVVPNVELAVEAGLTVSDGIAVDENMTASDPMISAIGDCTSFIHSASGRQVRLESIQNANDQANCVAAKLVGEKSPYTSVPWFWSVQYGGKLQIAGLTVDADEFVRCPSQTGYGFVVHCFKNRSYLGTECVGAPAEHIIARKLLALPNKVTKREMGGCDYNLMALLSD